MLVKDRFDILDQNFAYVHSIIFDIIITKNITDNEKTRKKTLELFSNYLFITKRNSLIGFW